MGAPDPKELGACDQGQDHGHRMPPLVHVRMTHGPTRSPSWMWMTIKYPNTSSAITHPLVSSASTMQVAPRRGCPGWGHPQRGLLVRPQRVGQGCARGGWVSPGRSAAREGHLLLLSCCTPPPPRSVRGEKSLLTEHFPELQTGTLCAAHERGASAVLKVDCVSMNEAGRAPSAERREQGAARTESRRHQ